MQVLCLQLQRVRWSNLGSPEKLHGHVAFPLSLNLDPYCAAAAAPLLGQGHLQPTGQGGGSAQTPQSPKDRGAAMPLEQRTAHVRGSASMHGCRGAKQHDQEEGHRRATPSADTYRLAAVIVHHGGPRSGHYSTYRSLLRACERESEERWICVSDESVREADIREVLACQAGLLFYNETYR